MPNTPEQRAKYYLKKKIKNALLSDYYCIFVTLTFTDKVLSKTNEKTREIYIKQFLKNESVFYIANRDYGKEKDREHYHAFLITSYLTLKDLDFNKIDYGYNIRLNTFAYKYGNIYPKAYRYGHKAEIIEMNANALTNHFIKETTKGARIIQSRRTPTKEEQINRLERFKKIVSRLSGTSREDLTLSQKLKIINTKQRNKIIDADFMEQEIKEIEEYTRTYKG